MNLQSVFDFIKEKRGYDYPVEYKLRNGIELSEDELNYKGELKLMYCWIKRLPDNFSVSEYVNLYKSSIESLPDNFYVGRSLSIERTNIYTIPKGLKVGYNFYVADTPLSKRYSVDEIRKMIVDNGGYVNGEIS